MVVQIWSWVTAGKDTFNVPTKHIIYDTSDLNWYSQGDTGFGSLDTSYATRVARAESTAKSAAGYCFTQRHPNPILTAKLEVY